MKNKNGLNKALIKMMRDSSERALCEDAYDEALEYLIAVLSVEKEKSVAVQLIETSLFIISKVSPSLSNREVLVAFQSKTEIYDLSFNQINSILSQEDKKIILELARRFKSSSSFSIERRELECISSVRHNAMALVKRGRQKQRKAKTYNSENNIFFVTTEQSWPVKEAILSLMICILIVATLLVSNYFSQYMIVHNPHAQQEHSSTRSPEKQVLLNKLGFNQTAPSSTSAGKTLHHMSKKQIKFGIADFNGVPQDHNKARLLFEKAATKGEVAAITNLGVLYAKRGGVLQDYNQARLLFEKAIMKGEITAITNLGVLYAKGYGVARNYDQARLLFEKAAMKGEITAMTNLGVLYAKGYGVAQDYDKAQLLFDKAAAARKSN